MIGDLTLERGLDQALGQLRAQATLAGQLQPAGAGPTGQTSARLLVHRVQIRTGGLLTPGLIQVRDLVFGHHISHQVLPP